MKIPTGIGVKVAPLSLALQRKGAPNVENPLEFRSSGTLGERGGAFTGKVVGSQVRLLVLQHPVSVAGDPCGPL